ncbi:hypothetical protein [Candidatus Leptofilum sp.]|uniref:hypothetical protein n=1 Tax=Candidatus Leptofilum sp. TaxID=3241576 RepID=UPI003B5CC1B7
MLRTLSIKSLYVPALAEGEGVGTAYEYFAKRLVLARWLKNQPKPAHLLIAGLPEKYGSSLDFLLLAEELGAAVTIVDERPSALQKLQKSLVAAQKEGWLMAASPKLIPVHHLADLGEIAPEFDLCLGSEGLQRLDASDRPAYMRHVRRLASRAALFAPNGDNVAHTNISGLAGITLAEMQQLARQNAQTGYIDMPPFPPGITRSDEQREQATSGRFEAIAMWGLGFYARLEHFLLTAVRRSQSHIVYALLEGGD